MDYRVKDMKDKKYGRLTGVKYIETREDGAHWVFRCDCGNEKEVMGNMLKQGHISSCGKCSFKSRGEFTINQILENHNINYGCEKKFFHCNCRH